MKRLISILVIVAMMLASVLAMIPAYATEGEVEGEGTVTEPITEYSVNWKELVENGTMRAQWAYERVAAQKNFEQKYKVTATETALLLTPTGGENRSYYSEVMFDITADTQYEYVFKADKTNDNCADAGVIFAWAADANAYKQASRPPKDDVDDIYPGIPKGPYSIMGNWGPHTNYKVHYGAPYDEYIVFGTASKTNLYDVKVDEEGFSTYKVVYNGLNVKMYVLNVNDEWVEFFADKEMNLVEGSKVAFGLTTWSPSHTNLKDCVVYAKNEAAVAAMNAAFKVDKSGFDAKLAEVETYKAADWFPADWATFTAKVEAGKAAAAAAESAKYQYVMDYATAKLEHALIKLNATASLIKVTLGNEIVAVDALVANPEVQALYTETSWNRMVAALEAAKTVSDAETSTQADYIVAYNALNLAKKGLLTVELAAKNAYTVNWKLFVENGTMRSQWLYNRAPGQNNMSAKYNIHATDSAIALDRNGKPGDHRQYYSEVMFDITDYTYYTYELEVKSNSPDGDGGFVFAFANNPKGRDEDDEKRDIEGNLTTNKVSAYVINGKLNDGTAGLYFGGAWNNYGYENEKNLKEALVNPKVSEDGYTNYKVVYNGYVVEVFYLNTADEWVELYADATITLAADAKVAYGIYAWGTDWANIRNCKITAYNDAASEVLFNTLTAYLFELADAKLAESYTPATEQAVKDAVAAVKAINADTPYEEANAAIVALIDAILGLKKADKTALNAAIDAANAAIADKTAEDFEERYYTPFAAALADALAITADENSTQEDVDAALEALVNTTKYLTPAGQACKVDLADVLAKYAALVADDYKPSSWATLADPFATAEALNAAELTNEDQADVDAAVVALNAAIDALVVRADFSKLNAAIERADALDKNDYIAESWKIDDVLAAAKVVAANFELEQAPIDEALAALNAAINELVTWRSNVLAIVPGDDYVCNSSEYGDNPSWYNKITDMSYYGLGNVFYYDYHKLLAAKAADGFAAGTRFPQSMKEMNIQGSADYTLRLGTNVSGSGSNRVTDGDRLGTALEHRADPTSINGKVYSHVFGFSFAKAPTVDSIAVYLPTNTKIVSIDVYGSVRQTLEDGTVLYGKTNKNDVVTEEGVKYEVGTAAKTYLGTVNVPAAAEGAENILATADFMQAMKVEYIYFAIQYAEGTGVNNYYYIYEIELFGLNDGETVDGKVAPDFSKFNAAYAAFDALVKEDYTEASIADVYAAIAAGDGIVNNVKGEQAAIDACGAALEAAVKALVANPADWTELDAAITLGTPITEAEYTPKTYTAFKAAYDAAVALRASSNVPQTAVDNATKLLSEMFAGLAKRADKSALTPAIDEAKTLVKEAWNGNVIAWNMFEKALNDAIALLADENTTQEQVDTVLDALKARRAELVANPGYVPPVEETEPAETDKPADETKAPETDKPADETDTPAADSGCGGCGSSAALSALAIVGVIGTAVVLKKKED